MLVRVLEIPTPSGNSHFNGGEPQQFVEVDWFSDENQMDPDEPGMMETGEGRQQVAEFIQGKQYFHPSKSYLVLHPSHSFTINYHAP